MTKPIYFQIDKFVDNVVEAMELGEINAPTLLRLRAAIETKVADRIIISFVNNFGPKEAKMFDKLIEDHPEITEIDALLLMSNDMPGLKLEIEKNVDSLYKELTYDSYRIGQALSK